MNTNLLDILYSYKNNKFKNLLYLRNDGSTMIEAIVSFAVLVIVLAVLFKMVAFSSELRMRAVDTANVRNSFNEQLYKIEYDDTGNRIDGSMENVKIIDYYGVTDPAPKTKNIAAFVMILDEEKTDVDSTFGSLNEEEKENIKKQITLPHLDAASYYSVDPIIEDEKLATPKVLKFHYDNK